MAGRFVRQLNPCACCNRRKPGHTAYHENARGFVCKRCFSFLDKNPTFKKMPFKGWIWVTKKESVK